MILIDLTHINSPGGVTLTKEIIKEIFRKKIENRVEILLDTRNKKFFKTRGIRTYVIRATAINSGFFYKRTFTKYNSLLCFANVPPY